MYVIRPYYGKAFYEDNDRNAFEIQCTVKTVGVGFFAHFVPNVKEHFFCVGQTEDTFYQWMLLFFFLQNLALNHRFAL